MFPVLDLLDAFLLPVGGLLRDGLAFAQQLPHLFTLCELQVVLVVLFRTLSLTSQSFY